MHVTFDDENKGRYVELSCDRTKARREVGFCDGVVVSDNFIEPGKLVAVEILETQRGWSGDLRVGFTMLPNHQLLPLPSFALPPLVTRGQSWIIQMGDVIAFLVSQRHQSFWKRQQMRQKSTRYNLNSMTNNSNIHNGTTNTSSSSSGDNSLIVLTAATLVHNLTTPDTANPSLTNGHTLLHNPIEPHLIPTPTSCSCCLHTPAGRVPFSLLVPTDAQFLRPPDVERGSIVAIYYELEPVHSDHVGHPTSYSHHPHHHHPESSANGLTDAMHSFVQLTGDTFPNSFGCDSGSVDPDTTPPDQQTSSLLYFIMKFHVVINGIDLIAAMKPIMIEPKDVSFFDQSNGPSDDDSPDSTSLGQFDGSSNHASALPLLRMRAVFDVYGQTKAIQLIALSQKPVPSLSRLCSCTILNQVVSVCDSEPDMASNLDFESSSSRPLRSSVALSRPGQTGLHPMDNLLLRRMISILNRLPLPRTELLKLQWDAYAIAARRLSD